MHQEHIALDGEGWVLAEKELNETLWYPSRLECLPSIH